MNHYFGGGGGGSCGGRGGGCGGGGGGCGGGGCCCGYSCEGGDDDDDDDDDDDNNHDDHDADNNSNRIMCILRNSFCTTHSAYFPDKNVPYNYNEGMATTNGLSDNLKRIMSLSIVSFNTRGFALIAMRRQ